MNVPVYPGRDAFRAPSPPTGPEAESYGREDGKPERFAAFLETTDGQAFIHYAASTARQALSRGDKRFSVLGYIHEYRALHRIRLNNSWAPLVADEILKRHPSLEQIIERRARKTAGAT